MCDKLTKGVAYGKLGTPARPPEQTATRHVLEQW